MRKLYPWQIAAREHGELIRKLHDVTEQVREMTRALSVESTAEDLRRIKARLEYLKAFAGSKRISDAERKYINSTAIGWR